MREVLFEGKSLEEMNIEKLETIVEKKGEYDISYIVQKVPMLTRRDFCIMACCRETEIDGRPATYYIQNSVNMKGYEPNSDAIRANISMCALIQPHNETDLKLSIVQYLDMGGWFPY